MNRKSEIFLVIFILVILLCVALVMLYFHYRTAYSNRIIKQTTINSGSTNENFSNNNSIEVDDLSIALSSINYSSLEVESSSSDNSMLNVVIDVTSKNGLGINLVKFDYLLFDDQNRILNSSLWGNLDHTKPYIVGFLAEKYGQTQFYQFNEHCIFSTSHLQDNVTENLKTVSKTISSSLNEPLTAPKLIQVRLINFEYQFEGENIHSLTNTDLEYVLHFQ